MHLTAFEGKQIDCYNRMSYTLPVAGSDVPSQTGRSNLPGTLHSAYGHVAR